MTISNQRPKQGTYDPNYNSLPATVCVGVSLVTLEEETFEQDGRAITCPVDSDITYITVPREVAYRPNGGSDWNKISNILDTEGYPIRLWTVVGVWIATPNHIAEEIF